MRRIRILAASGAILLLTLLVFGQVRSFTFLTLDDPAYVTNNPDVTGGLTWRGATWALTAMKAGNWHPLTWISHMADVSLFGLSPGPHHLMNLLFHAVGALVLLLTLQAATGNPWRSALVAALFAVHPLHVEAVAWVSERKEVLSALFATLAIAAWIRYARRPGVARYLACAGYFTLALAAKPMPVSLPVLLLALDFWPLDRVRQHPLTRLVAEKIPLLLMAGLASALTLAAQSGVGAVQPLARYSLAARAANAAAAPLVYLGRALWPADLRVFYPHAGESFSRPVFAATAFALALLTLVAVSRRRRWPWLAVGWAWYLVALAPVSGLVQVGFQAGADRYTYFPLTGALLAAVWSLPSPARRGRRLAVAAAACAAVGACAFAAHGQVRHWRDEIALFSHVLDIDPRDRDAHTHLGTALQEAGRFEEAVAHHRQAIRLCPECPDARYNLANALAAIGALAEAESQYGAALALAPERSDIWNNFGVALARAGRKGQARESFARARGLDERNAEAWLNLGIVLAEEGRTADAIEHFTRAIALDPGNWRARYHRAGELARGGDRHGALREYAEVLRANPGHAPSRAALAALGGGPAR